MLTAGLVAGIRHVPMPFDGAAGQNQTYRVQLRAEAPAVAARVNVELAADVLTSGALRKGVSVAVAGDAPK